MSNYIEANKKIFQEHFEHITEEYPNEDVVRFLARHRDKNQKRNLLDWGCATGRHTILGCKFGYQVYAADYVEHCIIVTREKVEQESKRSDLPGRVCKYIVNEDLDIPEISSESMDIILAWGVLFSNSRENQYQMVRNMYRMLKHEGRVFCNFRTERDSVYTDDTVGKETEEKGTFILQANAKGKSGLTFHIASLEELKQMFLEVGFEVENIELSEFTQENRKIRNSWWHVTLVKNPAAG